MDFFGNLLNKAREALGSLFKPKEQEILSPLPPERQTQNTYGPFPTPGQAGFIGPVQRGIPDTRFPTPDRETFDTTAGAVAKMAEDKLPHLVCLMNL